MDDVMKILEGACVDCDEDTEITRVGGTREFHRDHRFNGDHEVDVWKRGTTEIGEVEVECGNGHRNSAFALTCGDWTT